MKNTRVDLLRVQAYDSRAEMGQRAAEDVAAACRGVLAAKNACNMIFAAAPSQNEMLAALVKAPDIDWRRVQAFHMDEYLGLRADAPQRFGQYLQEHIFGLLPFGAVHLIRGDTETPEAECERYASLLRMNPVDIVCLGIGENGHLAFNDPPVADFSDPRRVKVVELDRACRVQQVNDGCFAALQDVPTHAITLTIPALLKAASLFCVVPGSTKANAVAQALEGPVSEQCPASILRTHPGARLYLDADSAEKLKWPKP